MYSTMMIVVLELICLILLMVCSSSSCSRILNDGKSEEVMGFRVNMRHIDDGVSSLLKRSQSAVERSKRRAATIATAVKASIEGGRVKPTDDIETPVHVGNGEFLIEMGFGTPVVMSQGVMDTGSDLTWTQCQPCKTCFEQSVPIFDPTKSSTFAQVGCNDFFCTSALGPGQPACSNSTDCQYDFSYAGGTSSKGCLAYESFTLGGNSPVSKLGFGCGVENSAGAAFGGNVTGIVGMARGPLSLVSQLGSKVGNKFSYCLLSYDDYFGGPPKTSPLLFGQAAQLSGGGVQTMGFVKNDQLPLFYYIPVTGITVGGKAIDIPGGTFDVKEDGSGGMIIDSGTSLIQLVEAAYTPLKEAMQSGIVLKPVDGSSVGLDLCYAWRPDSVVLAATLDVPTLTFNFEGGLNYDFPKENYFRQASDDLFCLAIIPLPADVFSPSILGNIAQQNFHILYDNDKNSLSFRSVKCDSL